MKHSTHGKLLSHDRSMAPLIAFALVVVLTGSLAFGLFQHAYAEPTAADKQAEAERVLANLNAMQQTLDSLSDDYGEALAAQEEAEKNRDAAEARLTEINGKIDDVQSRLNAHARDMYRTGSVSYLDTLLNVSSFEDFVTSWDILNRVNENAADLVQSSKDLAEEEEQQAAVYNEQATIASAKAEEAAQAAAQAEATVLEMQATYDSLSAEAAQLLEEERKAKQAEEAAQAAAVMAEAAAAAEREAAAEQQASSAAREASSESSSSSTGSAASANASSSAGADSGAGSSGDETNLPIPDDVGVPSSEGNENATSEAAVYEEGGDDSPVTADGQEGQGPDTVEPADSPEADAPSNDSEATSLQDEASEDDVAAEEPASEEVVEAVEEESAGSYEGGSDTVSRAYACLGAPYVWGGVGPGGYDCSGLVSYCLSGSHTRLGTTYTFMNWPRVANPQPGDIAVNSGHTGVYIGDGQMIHAATYGVGVIVGPVQSGMIFVRYAG